jgi:hypothetical protein
LLGPNGQKKELDKTRAAYHCTDAATAPNFVKQRATDVRRGGDNNGVEMIGIELLLKTLRH